MKIENAKKLIQKVLRTNGSKEQSKWQASYMKQVISFHGLAAPLVTQHWKKDIKPHLSHTLPEWKDQLELAYRLMKSNFSEEHSIGVHIMVSHLNRIAPRKTKKDKSIPEEAEEKDKEKSKPELSFAHEFLDTLGERVLTEGGTRDWAICDSVSSRVICEIIKRDPSVADRVAQWKDADYLWKKRSSCVSFVKIARLGSHNDRIIDICTTTVKCKERFAQLGTGWVLRELSLADHDRVVDFIKQHYNRFSREGLRYAIEKMDNDQRKELLAYRKTA